MLHYVGWLGFAATVIHEWLCWQKIRHQFAKLRFNTSLTIFTKISGVKLVWIAKVTKCSNLHVDTLNNIKYTFILKLHHVSSIMENWVFSDSILLCLMRCEFWNCLKVVNFNKIRVVVEIQHSATLVKVEHSTLVRCGWAAFYY